MHNLTYISLSKCDFKDSQKFQFKKNTLYDSKTPTCLSCRRIFMAPGLSLKTQLCMSERNAPPLNCPDKLTQTPSFELETSSSLHNCSWDIPVLLGNSQCKTNLLKLW